MAEAFVVKERTGAKVGRPVHKVCGMIERNTLRACGLAGAMVLFVAAFTLASGLEVDLASAETLKNPIAVFAALDKVTGRISHLEIPMNKTVAFGALKVTPRVCDTRPPTEAPNTASFVEVDKVKLTGEVQRIFTGWMFAESPGLHAVEQPVFDVWLTSCKSAEGVRTTSRASAARRPPPRQARRRRLRQPRPRRRPAPSAGRGGRAACAVALGQAAA